MAVTIAVLLVVQVSADELMQKLEGLPSNAAYKPLYEAVYLVGKNYGSRVVQPAEAIAQSLAPVYKDNLPRSFFKKSSFRRFYKRFVEDPCEKIGKLRKLIDNNDSSHKAVTDLAAVSDLCSFLLSNKIPSSLVYSWLKLLTTHMD